MIEVFRNEMEFANDQLKAIVEWLKEKHGTKVELREKS